MKKTELIRSWLLRNNLSRQEFTSLVYVPAKTQEDIYFKDSRFIFAFRRIYNLTEIEEFFVSDEEMKNPTNFSRKKPGQSAFEMAVSEFFVNRWKTTGVLPNNEESLSVKGIPNKNIGEHSELLKKKYFIFDDETKIWRYHENNSTESIVEDTKPVVEHIENTAASITDINYYHFLSDQIEHIAGLTEVEQKEYMKLNGEAIKRLYGNLHVLMLPGSLRNAFNDIKLKREKQIKFTTN